MAIVNTNVSSALKILSSQTDEQGQTKTRTKTYNNVRTESTDDAVYSTYNHIVDLMENTDNRCHRARVDELLDI